MFAERYLWTRHRVRTFVTHVPLSVDNSVIRAFDTHVRGPRVRLLQPTAHGLAPRQTHSDVRVAANPGAQEFSNSGGCAGSVDVHALSGAGWEGGVGRWEAVGRVPVWLLRQLSRQQLRFQ